MKLFAASLGLASALAAFQLDIRPSPLAWVGSAGTLAPLFGLPGATVWGDPVYPPFAAGSATVRRDRAVLISEGRVLVARTLSEPDPQWVELPAAFAPERAWINAAGTRGLLARHEPAHGQFISALDGAARVSSTVDLGAGWTAAAVSRDSDCALVARSAETGGSLVRVCTGKPETLLFSSAGFDPVSIAWLPGEQQAAVADRRASLVRIIDVALARETGAVPVDSPNLVETSAEGHLLVAAGDRLLRFSPERTQPPSLIPLPAQPAALERLASGFLFATCEDGMMLLIDWREEQAYVVPAR